MSKFFTLGMEYETNLRIYHKVRKFDVTDELAQLDKVPFKINKYLEVSYDMHVITKEGEKKVEVVQLEFKIGVFKSNIPKKDLESIFRDCINPYINISTPVITKLEKCMRKHFSDSKDKNMDKNTNSYSIKLSDNEDFYAFSQLTVGSVNLDHPYQLIKAIYRFYSRPEIIGTEKCKSKALRDYFLDRFSEYDSSNKPKDALYFLYDMIRFININRAKTGYFKASFPIKPVSDLDLLYGDKEEYHKMLNGIYAMLLERNTYDRLDIANLKTTGINEEKELRLELRNFECGSNEKVLGPDKLLHQFKLYKNNIHFLYNQEIKIKKTEHILTPKNT